MDNMVLQGAPQNANIWGFLGGDLNYTLHGFSREIFSRKNDARNSMQEMQEKLGFFGTKMGHFLSDFLLNQGKIMGLFVTKMF